MDHFKKTSHWDVQSAHADDFDTPVIIPEPEGIVREAGIKLSQLEDWSHRLQSAAYEAGDNYLEALESDLLALRDEVVSELHERL